MQSFSISMLFFYANKLSPFESAKFTTESGPVTTVDGWGEIHNSLLNNSPMWNRLSASTQCSQAHV
jgi:hypothetical protein